MESRFNSITAHLGWSAANRAMSLLRSICRWPCVDVDGLRNPLGLWLTGGGKIHRKERRKISTPAEVLPCWSVGIEAEVDNPAIRDALWFGLYTGMGRDEILTLRWEWVDMDALTFRVEETKTGVPLEFPIAAMYCSNVSPSVGMLWTSARSSAGSSPSATLPRTSCASLRAWSAVTAPWRPRTTRLLGAFVPPSPVR